MMYPARLAACGQWRGSFGLDTCAAPLRRTLGRANSQAYRMTALGAFELVLLLLTAAVLLALLARRLHAPPAVAFVLGGILLAVTPGIRALEFDPDLYMALFLPPLVQASAFFTVWREFRANLRPILLLSIGLVFFTAFSIEVAASNDLKFSTI